MNTLHNYIAAQRLAKDHLITAEIRLKKGDEYGAIEHLMKSIREFQTMTNIVAKLRFPKRARP